MLFKQAYPNLYIIITGIGILCWFKGMYGILDFILPTSPISMGLLALFGLAILYFNDHNLSEIHDPTSAAAIGAQRRHRY